MSHEISWQLLFSGILLLSSFYLFSRSSFQKYSSTKIVECDYLNISKGSWTFDQNKIFPYFQMIWYPIDPCSHSVYNAETFFKAYEGRHVVIIGDSLSRYFTYDFLRFILHCCPMGLPECHDELAAEEDPLTCEAIDKQPPYEDFHGLLNRRGKTVKFSFIWMGYPSEISKPSWMELFFSDINKADLVILSMGVWNLIFDEPDVETGLRNLLNDIKEVVDLFKYIKMGRPSNFSKQIIWRHIFPDEVDSPIRFRDKRVVPRWAYDTANTAITAMWKKAGFHTWNAENMVDVRKGTSSSLCGTKCLIKRSENERIITFDGQHFFWPVNVELAWNIFSYGKKYVL